MKKEFLIDEKRIFVDVSEIRFDSELCDVTAVGNGWAEYTHTGLRRVKICGKTEDGAKIDKVFRYKGKSETDILILESLKEQPVVGQGE